MDHGSRCFNSRLVKSKQHKQTGLFCLTLFVVWSLIHSITVLSWKIFCLLLLSIKYSTISQLVTAVSAKFKLSSLAKKPMFCCNYIMCYLNFHLELLLSSFEFVLLLLCYKLRQAFNGYQWNIQMTFQFNKKLYTSTNYKPVYCQKQN